MRIKALHSIPGSKHDEITMEIAANNTTRDYIVGPGTVSTQIGYRSSRSPLHRAAAIHFIHFNEAAAINRSGAIITEL